MYSNKIKDQKSDNSSQNTFFTRQIKLWLKKLLRLNRLVAVS